MILLDFLRHFLDKRKYKLEKLGKKVIIRNVHFEGRNSVFTNTILSNCFVGECSYISRNCKLSNVKIGKFCSIANDVHTCNGQHPTSVFVTTFPSFYYDTDGQIGFSFHKGQPLFNTLRLASGSNKYEVVIGNDVWIGSHVLIMPGVSIGDGAVIAAGSVVSRDVEPYTVVGGVPAKSIKKRFTESQIVKLVNLKWWDWPYDVIENRYREFDNIDKFIAKYYGSNVSTK